MGKWFAKVMGRICAPFLSGAEIDKILKGGDFCLDSDEIRRRLKHMATALVLPQPAVKKVATTGTKIVSSTALYGGTYNLFAHTLPQFGITTRFADHRDPAPALSR